MLYTPRLTDKEIKNNHKYFAKRISIYRKKGLDFPSSRDSIIAKAAPIEGSILEVGTGTGYASLSLAKAGYRFISIDTDEEAVKTAALNLVYKKLLSQATFYIMDGTHTHFENSSFKNIVMIDLLHHIYDIRGLLSETDRVLSANGKLILADFNKSGMKIVDGIHKQEGRIHADSGFGKDYAYKYLYGLGYEIESYRVKCHWVLIAKKIISQ